MVTRFNEIQHGIPKVFWLVQLLLRFISWFYQKFLPDNRIFLCIEVHYRILIAYWGNRIANRKGVCRLLCGVFLIWWTANAHISTCFCRKCLLDRISQGSVEWKRCVGSESWMDAVTVYLRGVILWFQLCGNSLEKVTLEIFASRPLSVKSQIPCHFWLIVQQVCVAS